MEELDAHNGAEEVGVSGDELEEKYWISPSSQTHVLWQRPARQALIQASPQRCVISEVQPYHTVRGLEFDKG